MGRVRLGEDWLLVWVMVMGGSRLLMTKSRVRILLEDCFKNLQLVLFETSKNKREKRPGKETIFKADIEKSALHIVPLTN